MLKKRSDALIDGLAILILIGIVLCSSVAFAQTPAINSISPNSGVVGMQVQINGSGFGASQGTSSVAFNGINASATSWSDASITVTLPSNASSGPFSVTISGHTAYSSSFAITALPTGWLDEDIGSVSAAGSATYANGVFTVKGAGVFGGTADTMHFVYQPLSGDGSIIARVVSMPTGSSKVGVMLRETLDPGSTNANTVEYIPFGQLLYFQLRATTGGSTTQPGSGSASAPPYWVKLVRSGSTFSSYGSLDGMNWTQVATSQTISMAQNVNIGLVVTSGSVSSLATATFDNVSVSSSASPAPMITGLSATTGNVGSQVVLNGSGFGAAQDGSVVTLNGTPATINSWSDSAINITIPAAGTTGSLVVSVAPSMNNSNPVRFQVTAQPLPTGWLDQDIGAVSVAGSATYANGVFTVKGAGNLAGTADTMHFVYQPLSGDGSIVARVVSMPTGSGNDGVMVRETLNPASAYAGTVDNMPYGALVYFQLRATTAGNTTQPGDVSNTAPPYWVKLVRSGSTFSSYASLDGMNWTQVGTSQTVNMAQNVDIGLVVSSGSVSSLATVTFDNVSVSSSAAPAPVITGLSATTGNVGSQVVLNGSGFGAIQSGSAVTLNGTSATINSWSDSAINITIPAAGTTGLLVVSVSPEMNNSNPVRFEVTAQPLPAGWLDVDIGSVSVAGSATYANGVFTVEGAGIFGGTADTMHFVYQPVSGDGSIVARVTSMPTGNTRVGVMIRETLASSATNANTVEYIPYGQLVYFQLRATTGGSMTQPGSGSAAAPPYWVKVVRSGSTFSSYGSLNGTSWTQIGTSQTINMAQNVDVGLVVASGSVSSLITATFDNVMETFSSQAFAPLITNLSTNVAVPGTPITISGTNFGSAQGVSTVTFNGTTAPSSSWSATNIVAPVPMGATSGNIVITVGGLASNAAPFTVSQTPTINSLSQTSGPVGTSVTIAGVNFGSTQGTSAVTFNGTTATPTNWNATSIVVPVPNGATTGNIVITVNGMVSAGTPFTVFQIPSITSLSAASTTIGAVLTINGTNFGGTQSTSTVTFNGVIGTPVTWSATSIAVPIPVGATTGNVVVTVNALQSNGVPLSVVMVPLPPVAQVLPTSDATGVPENGRVVVRFTQPVQAAAVIPGVVSLSQGVNKISGNLALSNDRLSLTFTPGQNLSANTSFAVAATSLTSNQTTPEFQSSFTTSSTTDTVPPNVVQTNPPSAATGVPINAPVMVQFTKAMDPATLNAQTFVVSDQQTDQLVNGTIQVDASGLNASFVPQPPFAVNRSYYATLKVGIQDTSGNSLGNGQMSFSFTTSFDTDSQGPTMTAVSPQNEANGIPLNALVVLEFDKPLDLIGVSNGFQVQENGVAVAGGIAFSDGNKRLTFTPQVALVPNATYTIVTNTSLADLGNFPLQNPGSFTFTTGANSDATTPSVVSVNPAASATNVPTNVVLKLQFSKPIDPITVNNGTWNISADNGQALVSGTITVSGDGMSAMFAPSNPLDPGTNYLNIATNGITDMEGHGLTYLQNSFATGFEAVTQPSTVTTISPANGLSNVPLNMRINVVLSGVINAQTVGSNAVTVQGPGGSVGGAISLNGGGTVLTFTPATLLTSSTIYTVSVGGFADQAGNLVTPFTSSFTTTSSSVENTISPAVVNVSPVSGASSVPVNSPIILTFNEPIDLTTVNDSTVQIWMSGSTGVLAGNYTLDATGTILTFTPISPLPGNATIDVQVVNGSVSDLSGNQSGSFFSTFTTAAVADTTAPTVTMITPQNGTTDIGLNSRVVLTFSKSLNSSTITNQNFGLMVNGILLDMAISTSADNRVVTLNPFSWPPSSTVTVIATGGVKDLSGNSLVNFQSQFTTAPPFDTAHPSVSAQHPGNGARNVPFNTNIVLYLSEAMNSSSVQNAIHVAQNGVLVSGTTQVTDNGQVVQFTPSLNWTPNALVQISLDSTAVDINGNSANSYQASFTTAADIGTVAPTVVSTNPSSGIGVPTNVVIDAGFNEPIDPTSLNADSIQCNQNGIWFQSAVSLVANGTVIQVIPRFPLQPNTTTTCQFSPNLRGLNGLAFSWWNLSFTTGSGPDTTVPALTSVSPSNGSMNVGDNADIRLVFSKPINPLTVNTSTIQLTGGGVTVVPDSITFSNNNKMVLLVPHAPLPDSTQMTLTISGITDDSGNAVAPQTVQFTTGIGPDVISPVAVMESPYSGETNVPVNAVISLQVNEPIDPGSVNSSTMPVTQNNLNVQGIYSVSADGKTISFVPSSPLAANQTCSVYFVGGRGITDLAGNLLVGDANESDFTFTTGSTASVSGPQVLSTSPVSGASNLPTNTQVVVQFNEPVNSASLAQITLSGGSGSVSLSKVLTNGNQTLALTPLLPLQTGTAYSLSVMGVADLSGNILAPPATINFTTGSGETVNVPTVVSQSPVSGATAVPTNSVVQVSFNKPIDPLTVTNGTFQVFPSTTDIPISGAINMSADGLTATFIPTLPLDSATTYIVIVSNGITDLAGQSLNSNQISFTTGTGTIAEPPVIATIYPGALGTVGSTVYVRGTYFGTSQGTSTLTFNGATATPTSWSDTQIAVSVPSGATSGPIVATVSGVSSNALPFTVRYTPSITNVSASTVSAGTVLTITGSNFGSSNDSTTVQFNANLSYALYVTPSSWTETSLTVTVPVLAETGNMLVFVNGIQSNAFNLTVLPTPSISTLAPNAGVTGTPVEIVGANFGAVQGSSTVNFNGVPAASVTSWGDSIIIATPPANVTSGPVTVVENSISSNSDVAFTVTNPAIGSIDPPAAAANSAITLSGSGLTSQGLMTQVLFNGVAGSVSQSSTSNSLIVTVPSNATSGPVTVVVGNVTSNSMPFTVEQPPTITAVTPTQGPFDVTTGLAAPITITGSGFGATQSNSTVQFFGSADSANIQSWSDTSISAWVPADAVTGPLMVQVGGLTALAPSWFTINRITQLTDSLGNSTQYSVAVAGGSWFTAASQGSGCSSCSVRGTITSTADGNGNPTTTTDELGHTTTYTYDSNNNMASESRQLDAQITAITSYTYNSFGEVLTATDPLGNITTNTYDVHGNMLSVTSPAPDSHTPASVTQFAYDTKGEMTQITDPLGHMTTLTYNPVGLIATITDVQNNVTTYGYDVHGNRTSVIDALHNQTSFAYDAGDRLTTITYPSGSTMSFAYDSRGRRTSVTDQNGKITTYTYDDADRLIAVTDPAHNTTQYVYDAENNLLSITDANGHVTSFTYDAFGRVTQTAFPSSLAETYAYDAVGNLISKTDRKGQIIQYVYDALNRMTQKNNPDSTGVEYVYDLVGKIKQVTDPTGLYGFAYDNMGRLIGTTTQYSFLPGQTFTNAYTYDVASNRTGFTAPDGSTNSYSYDTLNRLSSLTNSLTGQFGFSYDALSRRAQLTRPNAVNTNYSYDSLSRLLSVLHQTGTTTLDGDSYTYDLAGNRTSKTNYLNGTTENYTYDPLYELTQVTQGSSTTETYSYDPVGNRLSSLTVPSYTYNSSNELTSDSTGSYTYDANGNALTDPSGKSYTWDFENRLTQVTLPGAGGTVTFKYDPLGHRIQKSSSLGTTDYLYDGVRLTEQIDNSGILVAEYVQGANFDEPFAQLRSGTTSYYEQDGVNSVTSLTNVAGVIASSFVYESFGKLSASAGTIANSFQYTGREYDSETDNYFYRARYYNMAAGRFFSEDPIRFSSGSVNFYSYVNGDPIGYDDPSGKTRIHGHWCGPNWTGGLTEMYNPAHKGIYIKPQDPVDEVCEHHDICYYNCRAGYPCNKGDRRDCMRRCDIALENELNYGLSDNANHGLNYVFWNSIVDLGITIFNEPWPDAGPDGGPNGNIPCNGCKQTRAH